MKLSNNIQWWSRIPNGTRSGPFKNELEAWSSVLEQDNCPIQGAQVWCALPVKIENTGNKVESYDFPFQIPRR
jgi:hypothetical protein